MLERSIFCWIYPANFGGNETAADVTPRTQSHIWELCMPTPSIMTQQIRSISRIYLIFNGVSCIIVIIQKKLDMRCMNFWRDRVCRGSRFALWEWSGVTSSWLLEIPRVSYAKPIFCCSTTAWKPCWWQNCQEGHWSGKRFCCPAVSRQYSFSVALWAANRKDAVAHDSDQPPLDYIQGSVSDSCQMSDWSRHSTDNTETS
jgi:hypothetical protein